MNLWRTFRFSVYALVFVWLVAGLLLALNSDHIDFGRYGVPDDANGTYYWLLLTVEAPIILTFVIVEGVYSAYVSAAWPLTALAIFALCLFKPKQLALLLGELPTLKRFRLGAAEVELSDENKQLAQQTAEETNKFLKAFREKLNGEIAKYVDLEDLPGKLKRMVHEEQKVLVKKGDLSHFRCTIHIEDFLVEGRLSQLLGYYPSAKGAGRHWSMRYGVIGKVWRTNLAQLEGKVVSDPPKNASDLIRTICLGMGPV